MSHDTTFDVAIVGGGVVGAAIAWRFAQRGLRVGLFERARVSQPNGPATLAAAGILSAQAEGEVAGPLFDLLREAELAHARLASEVGADAIGYSANGVLRVALDEPQLEMLERERQWQRALGLTVEALNGEAARALEPALAPAVVGANLFPAAGRVDSRALLAALLAQGARSGVTRQVTTVEAVEIEAARVRGLRTAHGQVSAPMVAVAAGAWSGELQGIAFVPQALHPIRGQMLELSAPAPLPTRVVFGAGGYVVPRGQRLLVGSTMETVGFDAGVTVEGQERLWQRAQQLCPALAKAVPTDAWFGFRPSTEDGLPAIGPTPIAGLHLAVGFRRNGILLAPRAAELVVAAALGETGRIAPAFSAARLLC